MASVKKVQVARRCGTYNLLIGLLSSFIPYVLLRSFTYAYFMLAGLVTFSTLNVMHRSGKTFSKFWLDCKHSDFGDLTVQSILKYGLTLTTGICVYYVAAVLFGASVIESCTATLYFSCFMVILTVYPLCWYFCFSDNGMVGIIQIFSESKCDTAVENYFQLTVKWCIIGAWLGAFPIPLDWDRPWQIWPTTCCIGATLGYAAAHLFISVITLWTSYKEKKQFSWKIFV